MPITPYDAKGLFKTAIRGNDPVLFFEHKRGYEIHGEVPDAGVDYTVPFGEAVVQAGREGCDHCGCFHHGSQSAGSRGSPHQLGIDCEVIDPRTIYPFDYDTVIKSISKTHRLIVTHESNRRSGIGAEIVSQVVDKSL